MAVRLQMKLGYAADAAHLPGSPDAILSEEPTIGSVVRSKGSLYLIVTARTGGPKVGEATRMVADAIRDAYYYDESAGIVVCLEKAIRAANKRILHQRDRLGGDKADESNGPLGVGLAVVRGNELYVVTVGPAEAFLVRQARLSTLPDPNRARGLPSNDLEPSVWRGEINVGDSLVLASENLVAKLGPDGLKDAILTLHPQSAMEQVHARFSAAGGTGSDAAIAIEATEVSVTSRQRRLVPVQAPEPLAGTPDRSPIPLADSVSDAASSIQETAGRATAAAGGAVGRGFGSILDRLPRRRQGQRTVTPASSRLETQRRAAIAVLAFVALALVLVFATSVVSFFKATPGTLTSITAAQHAFEAAQSDLDQVNGNGVDLILNDRNRAQQLLTDAWQQLAAAEAAGISTSVTAPLRAQARTDLDEFYKMLSVNEAQAFSFGNVTPPVDLKSLILGPDGAPYVLDAASKSVYRIDLKGNHAVVIAHQGEVVQGIKMDVPQFIADGGPDLLILDAKNVLWRWRPADATGRGTLVRLIVRNSSSWGNDIRGIGTFLRSANQGLYNLYVIDPSQRNIMVYTPALDGSFPAASIGRLSTAQDVSTVDAMLIDGDIYVTEGGVLNRFVNGASQGWKPGDPGDEILRAAPKYTLLTTDTARDTGLIYAYDQPNARIIAIDKDSGSIIEQYQLTGNDPSWSDLRGLAVIPGTDGGPATMYWIDKTRLMTSVLVAVPTASASPSPSVAPTPSAKPTPKPTKKPTPKPTKRH
ncbi:MAG TPA: hypothetical protein VKR24_02600 [Candidatus Limnocylindrales bacterium]|nr:hypothetical protein [Candidatus Limnocylindrales bacterium]